MSETPGQPAGDSEPPDGWSLITGWSGWRDGPAGTRFVPGGDDGLFHLTYGGWHLGFGVAEPMDPEGWPARLAEVRRQAGW